jgi:hypothetical protein
MVCLGPCHHFTMPYAYNRSGLALNANLNLKNLFPNTNAGAPPDLQNEPQRNARHRVRRSQDIESSTA